MPPPVSSGSRRTRDELARLDPDADVVERNEAVIPKIDL
jgi:hypothetical protein